MARRFIADEHVDWPGVRRAYEGDDLSVDDIIEQFGLSRDRLYRRVRTQGWPTRRDHRRRSPPRQSATTEPSATAKRAALAARLFHALEERIMAIEEEALVHDASHGERDAKALTAMARALDMLGEMLEANEPTAGERVGPHEGDVDVDEFRQQLTQRLDRLRTSGSRG